jgi:hypothetical protein
MEGQALPAIGLIIDDATHVRLRSERTQGKTRVYTITVTCSDGSGQTKTKNHRRRVASFWRGAN